MSWDQYATSRFRNISRTCRYMRIGMNDWYEEPEIKAPRTTLDQVKDLHALLEQTGVPGPYILVGHSIAGYNMVLYTDQYPDEVVGLVCVGCGHPAFDDIFLEKLGPESPEDLPGFKEARLEKDKALHDWKYNPEGLDIATSNEQVLKVTSLGDRPFIILDSPVIFRTAYPEVDQLRNEVWSETNELFSKLSTRSQWEVVPNTNHISIIKDKAVDQAVQEVYDAVKKP